MVSSNELRGASDPQSVIQQQLPAAAPTAETASTVLAAQAVAVIQARTALAVARPRDLDVVRQRLLKECKRPGFAKVAIYRKPIGDGVEGLSIRFVEAAIRCMGNISTDVFVTYDDDLKRILRVVVTDLENNIPYTQEIIIAKTIERRNHKKGDVVLRQRLNSSNQTVYLLQADDEQILDKVNALTSKAIRTQGLRVVPGDIADECEALCYKIRADEAAKDPDGERRAIIDAFGTLGVTVDQLKQYLRHDGSSLTPKELSALRGLYVALRDEETTWAEIMDHQQKKPPPEPHQTQKQENKPADAPAGSVASKEYKAAQEAKNKEATARVEAIQSQRVSAPYDPADPAQDEFATGLSNGKKEEDQAAADGRITFTEIVNSIGAATDPNHIQENIIPMITEATADEGRRNSLKRMAETRIATLTRQQQKVIE